MLALTMLLALLLTCALPEPLPTAAAATEQLDRSDLPPLYRQLYDYAFLPKVQYQEQRVRLFIWLKGMEFTGYQLGLLDELAVRTEKERLAVEAEQRKIVQSYEPTVGASYDRLWERLKAGASDAELAGFVTELDGIHKREAELLELRARSVRALFEAQAPFLRTLTPKQEILFSDATFCLRQRLDPYANPGDFNALIGSVYVAGEFGALTRPTFEPGEDHLNIGGLWSEDPETLSGPYFPDARREVILYMVLLEPALPEAVAAAKAARASEPSLSPSGTPGLPASGAPPAALPGAPAPGIPVAPPPGIPVEPPPG